MVAETVSFDGTLFWVFANTMAIQRGLQVLDVNLERRRQRVAGGADGRG
jgi:hypothetical protein